MDISIPANHVRDRVRSYEERLTANQASKRQGSPPQKYLPEQPGVHTAKAKSLEQRSVSSFPCYHSGENKIHIYDLPPFESKDSLSRQTPQEDETYEEMDMNTYTEVCEVQKNPDTQPPFYDEIRDDSVENRRAACGFQYLQGSDSDEEPETTSLRTPSKPSIQMYSREQLRAMQARQEALRNQALEAIQKLEQSNNKRQNDEAFLRTHTNLLDTIIPVSEEKPQASTTGSLKKRMLSFVGIKK